MVPPFAPSFTHRVVERTRGLPPGESPAPPRNDAWLTDKRGPGA